MTDTQAADQAVVPDGWTDLDSRAVDTIRVLAADAVQKVGNGHPGTAMSLAPVAYLLFQKVMRHNPADTHWPGRDRFVLSCGHSSLTLYLQLYLGGFGLELDDIKSLRTWDSKTPGHPEYGHTDGVEITTGPLGQGIANAVGMAMAARRERGLLDPDAAPGESPFDHQIYALASDGDIEEGVSSEASSLAGTQRLGNLTLIYDSNRISIEDDTNIALSEDVAARYAAYGWHVQTIDWTNDDTNYDENVAALQDAIETARGVTDQPSFIQLRTIIGWPAPKLQGTGKAHGAALGDEEVAATKKVLGFDPEQTFEVADEVIAHTRKLRDRGQQAQDAWQQQFDTWAAANPEGKALYDRFVADELSPGWDDDLPSWDADPKGIATRAASGKVINAITPKMPELWGGSADLAESNNTTPEGEPSFLPTDRQSKMFPGNPYGRVLHFGIREHAMGAIMNGIKVHGGTRPYGATFLTFSDYMRPCGAAVRADAGAGALHLDPRLDRPGRGRTDPPADRAPRRPAGHPGPGRRPAGRRQRDRGLLGGDPAAQGPPGRPDPDPAGAADRAARRGRLRRHLRGGQGRVRAQGRRGRPRRDPDRHRLGGAVRGRGAASCWPTRASRPGWSRCPAASGSTSRTRPTATRSSRRRSRPGSASRPAWPAAGGTSSATPAGSSASTTTAPARRAPSSSRSSASPPRRWSRPPRRAWPPRIGGGAPTHPAAAGPKAPADLEPDPGVTIS